MAKKKVTKKVTSRSSTPVKKSSSTLDFHSAENHSSTASMMKSGTPVQRKRMYAIFIVAALIILILFAMRGYLVAAMVNGQPISRLKVIGQLEKQGGKQILDSLVTQSLITQEAQKRGITVSDEDIKKDLATIEANYKKQGQTLDQVLKMYGVTREEVIEQRKPFILLEKMIGKDVKVTDKEIQDFITKNNEAYGGTLTAAQVKQDLTAEKMKANEQTFIEKLQKNAKVDYFVSY